MKKNRNESYYHQQIEEYQRKISELELSIEEKNNLLFELENKIQLSNEEIENLKSQLENEFLVEE